MAKGPKLEADSSSVKGESGLKGSLNILWNAAVRSACLFSLHESAEGIYYISVSAGGGWCRAAGLAASTLAPCQGNTAYYSLINSQYTDRELLLQYR